MRVSEVTSSSITVQWEPVDCMHHNGNITGYLVRYGRISTHRIKTKFISGAGVTETVISGLKSSTNYSIQVAAVGSIGTGNYSSAIFQLTYGMPSLCMIFIYMHYLKVKVPVLSAGTNTATSISLSWTSAGSEAVSYEVMWETDDIGGCSGGSDMDSTTITDGSTSYDIMGLEEDSSYTITVTASNSAGSSADSNIVTAMTLEAGER